jgi:hypothetical protein
MKQTETNAKQILFRFVSVRTEIYFCLFRGHPSHHHSLPHLLTNGHSADYSQRHSDHFCTILGRMSFAQTCSCQDDLEREREHLAAEYEFH